MANRGKAFALPIKHHFGPVELSDQLAAMKQALQQFPQLDRQSRWLLGMELRRILHPLRARAQRSIQGRSFGCSRDATGATTTPSTPSATWACRRITRRVTRTARRLILPADLHGQLLEVHGTSDDNVHMQNTIQMVNNLIEAGKQFQLMVYPRQDARHRRDSSRTTPLVPHDRRPLPGDAGAGQVTGSN